MSDYSEWFVMRESSVEHFKVHQAVLQIKNESAKQGIPKTPAKTCVIVHGPDDEQATDPSVSMPTAVAIVATPKAPSPTMPTAKAFWFDNESILAATV